MRVSVCGRGRPRLTQTGGSIAVLERGSTAWIFSSSTPLDRLELDRIRPEDEFCVSSFCSGGMKGETMDPRWRMEAWEAGSALATVVVCCAERKDDGLPLLWAGGACRR